MEESPAIRGGSNNLSGREYKGCWKAKKTKGENKKKGKGITGEFLGMCRKAQTRGMPSGKEYVE